MLILRLVSPAVDQGWYTGRCRGKTGLVPGNYLEFNNRDNPTPPSYIPAYSTSRREGDHLSNEYYASQQTSKIDKNSIRLAAKDRSSQIVAGILLPNLYAEQMAKHKAKSASSNSLSHSRSNSAYNQDSDSGGGSSRYNSPAGSYNTPELAARPPVLKSNQSYDPPAPNIRGIGDVISRFQPENKDNVKMPSNNGMNDSNPQVSERPAILKSNQTYEPPAPIGRDKPINAPPNKIGDIVNRMQDSSIDTQRSATAKKPAPPPPKSKPGSI